MKIKNFINSSELPKYYAIGDIFVLPSSYEPFGLATNEAMCFSLPVILSSACGCAGTL